MTPAAVLFLLVNAAALLAAPRRWAALPLVIGACYITYGQGVEAGPFSFNVLRILILIGLMRIMARGERIAGGLNGLDWLFIPWSLWLLASTLFRAGAADDMVYRLGQVFTICGVYFLLRVFCQSIEDVQRLVKVTAIVLLPVALAMVYEKLASYNLFSIFGDVPSGVMVREGRLRARGPFGHPILAGTVGAVCLPMMLGLWQRDRRYAMVGLFSGCCMILASASSGPLLSSAVGVMAIAFWGIRDRMRSVRWLAVAGYIGLDLVMKAPAYYLMGRIDLAGGSSGYHRALLIDSALRHLDEWWLAGTNYTRHWMPTGVSWSGDHTDITNHYLHFGVLGGLPLMFLFIAMLAMAFRYVGLSIRRAGQTRLDQFLIWSLGASLAAQAATCLSVSYFDQSFLFLYLTLAGVSSAWNTAAEPATAPSPARGPAVEEANSYAALVARWDAVRERLRLSATSSRGQP